MGKVYWNMPEIPIPPEAYRHKSDHSVRITVTNPNGGYQERTIGYFTSATHMHPNEYFRLRYPVMWSTFYDDKGPPPSELYMGMYALTLGIGYKTTLYPLLQQVYGPEWGNALIDYSMYNVLFHSDVTQTFPEVMNERVLFSRKMYSDSDYSSLFKDATKDQHHHFRALWLKHCKDVGISKVWICIDGSNIDNQAQNSEFTENGCPKSHSQKPVIGFMYAVSSENGMPISYLVYEGGTVDSVKFHEMLDLLTGAGIVTEGVILDRGFCTNDVISYLQHKGIDFVIMMPEGYHGCKTMKEQYASTIRDRSLYAVDDDGVFGIDGETQLFTTHETKAVVNLYYDRVRGSIQSTKLHREIRREKKRLKALIEQGKKAVVASGMGKYFTVTIDDAGNQELITDYNAWDEDLMGKGYFAIVSSKPFGPERVLQIYGFREMSEVQYSLLKSHEGYDTARVHSSPGIRSKFACAFLSSIIRCEIQLACKALDLDTNVMIARVDQRIRLILSSPDSYTLSRAFRTEELSLLGWFGITIKLLDEMAASVTKRAGIEACNQVRRIPEENYEKIQKRRGRGRPKGSKNKKTLEREAEELRRKAYEPNGDKPVKKKGGRPKGSKDKYPRKRRTKQELQEVTSA